jgi:hypothetical protein
MGTSLSLTIINKEGVSDMEFYLNTSGSISIAEPGISGIEFYSEISKEDWEDLKEFIDRQFKSG